MQSYLINEEMDNFLFLDVENKLINKYWKNYARTLSTVVKAKGFKEVKVLNRNQDNLIAFSKISFFINPIECSIIKNN